MRASPSSPLQQHCSTAGGSVQICRDAPAATLGPARRGLVRGAAGTLSPISLLTEETMNDDR